MSVPVVLVRVMPVVMRRYPMGMFVDTGRCGHFRMLMCVVGIVVDMGM